MLYPLIARLGQAVAAAARRVWASLGPGPKGPNK